MLTEDLLFEDENVNITMVTNQTVAPPTVCNKNQSVEPWDTYVTYKVVINVFVVFILCLFGFVGNALSVAVLCKDQDRKNATNWLLQLLAIVDTVYLVTSLFIQTLKTIHDHTDWIPGLKQVFPYLEPYIWAVGSTAQTATVWMVLLVTTDRYVAICKPLNPQLRSIKRAKVAVGVLIVLSVIYNLPRFFERELIWKYEECTNSTKPASTWTALKEKTMYVLIYKTICYFVFRSLGPLFVLIFLNLQLISALRLVHRKQKEMTNRNKMRSENITTMLVAVVSVFIVCEMPDSILRILYTIHVSTNHFEKRMLRYCNITTNMLLTINSSINFIIYCLIGKKFRKILNGMCFGASDSGISHETSETEPLTMKSTVNVHNVKNGAMNANSTIVKEEVQL